MSKNINIRFMQRSNPPLVETRMTPIIYTPGEIITEQREFMRGHGTYEEDGYLKADVAGVKEQIHKLISVRPLKSRYNGEVGDVIVGRIIEVQHKRWKVDTNSRLDSVLLLQCLNLPGGEVRRRSAEDEHMMRQYLQEGDLISAEVKSVFSDGSLSLHIRNAKYGKLSQGVFVKVSPSLVRRTKLYVHHLPVGVTVILGSNGYIWICPIQSDDEKTIDCFVQNLEEVISRPDRETIARVRNCILALASCKVMLFDTSILYAYEESLKYSVSELLLPEAIADICFGTQYKLNSSD